LAEVKSLKLSITAVYKIAACVAQLVKCFLLHAYSRKTAAPNCASTNKNFIIAYLTSWHNRIFGYKLRTIEAKNP